MQGEPICQNQIQQYWTLETKSKFFPVPCWKVICPNFMTQKQAKFWLRLIPPNYRFVIRHPELVT